MGDKRERRGEGVSGGGWSRAGAGLACRRCGRVCLPLHTPTSLEKERGKVIHFFFVPSDQC